MRLRCWGSIFRREPVFLTDNISQFVVALPVEGRASAACFFSPAGRRNKRQRHNVTNSLIVVQPLHFRIQRIEIGFGDRRTHAEIVRTVA